MRIQGWRWCWKVGEKDWLPERYCVHKGLCRIQEEEQPGKWSDGVHKEQTRMLV